MNTSKHPKKASQQVAKVDWHKAYIVAALHAQGTTLRQLSKRHGYIPTTLAHALHRPYAEAERIIAAELGLSPAEIWPSRYQQAIAGNPRHHKRAANMNGNTASTGSDGNQGGAN